MTSPHIMFRDRRGKLHATPSLAAAADLGDVLGSEVFARTVLSNMEAVLQAFRVVRDLEAEYGTQISEQDEALLACRNHNKSPASNAAAPQSKE